MQNGPVLVTTASEELETTTLDDNNLLLAARLVREHYYPKRYGMLPDWILVFAVKDFLRNHPPISPEDLGEVIVKRPEIKTRGHLSRFLAAAISTEASRSRVDTPNVFSGARPFSLTRMAAMCAYLTGRGSLLCKTRLTKLLFYSDFVNYNLYSQSISGARYVRNHNGPELVGYDRILKTVELMGAVSRDRKDRELLEVNDAAVVDRLTVLELLTLHWVWWTFGAMTADELTENAQSESVHRFTRVDDPIAYEYARLLQRVPDTTDL